MTPRISSHARPPGLMWALLLLVLGPVTLAMTQSRKLELREEARNAFRHGWDNYWTYAFPEDEIKPLSCAAHHRDRSDPRDIGRNDALGDISLTAIDSLSTLAIMARSDKREAKAFWETVEELGRIYWYNKPKNCHDDTCGNRTSEWGRFHQRPFGSRGFDVDAKVQVFETTIRGVGGLLSAHLFATSALPSVPEAPSEFLYRDELLYLAEDLAKRLLPALTESPTGIPYPRINLRYGLPHGTLNPKYFNRPLTPLKWKQIDEDIEHPSESSWEHPRSYKRETPSEETTETCTAGAGSLVLEFTTLSRLTGNPVYELAAKRAFDEIWRRRSNIGLLGTGINAETGLWEGAISGVGAGVDSFYEYAFKSYVLLANTPDEAYFLDVWETSRKALEKHNLVREPVQWWSNVHLATGEAAQGSQWIDSLGAFFGGVLSGAGSMEEGGDDALELAVRGHLVYTALWSKYHALPERFNTRLVGIEGGLSWYPGRPEFVESTYFLYRATKDPFWLHVGEMVMKDLKERCRSTCGWAGLQDVRTGERQDRMESFWLSETWKYLFLLFDDDNQLHKLGDKPWIFTTEGHPLILPSKRPSYFPEVPFAPAPPRTCRRPTDFDFFSPMSHLPNLYHSYHFSHTIPSPPLLPTPPSATSTILPSGQLQTTISLFFPATPFNPRKGPFFHRTRHYFQILSLDSLRLTLIPRGDGALRIATIAGTEISPHETIRLNRRLLDQFDKSESFEVFLDDVVELILESGRAIEGAVSRGGKRPEEGTYRVIEISGDGCNPLPSAGLGSQTAVVCRRGGCSFQEKVEAVGDAGLVIVMDLEDAGDEAVAPVVDGTGRAALVLAQRKGDWEWGETVVVRSRYGVTVGGTRVAIELE